MVPSSCNSRESFQLRGLSRATTLWTKPPKNVFRTFSLGNFSPFCCCTSAWNPLALAYDKVSRTTTLLSSFRLDGTVLVCDWCADRLVALHCWVVGCFPQDLSFNYSWTKISNQKLFYFLEQMRHSQGIQYEFRWGGFTDRQLPRERRLDGLVVSKSEFKVEGGRPPPRSFCIALPSHLLTYDLDVYLRKLP